MNPDITKLLFVCSLTGRRLKLPFDKTKRLLCECSIGWIKPIEWLRYLFDGVGDANYLTGIQPAGLFFGCCVLTRAYRWLTIDTYRGLYEASRLETGTFNAHAARFRKAFEKTEDEKVDPLEHQRRSVESLTRIPAYRLRPPLTALVIIGVAPECGVSDDDIDYTVFLDR